MKSVVKVKGASTSFLATGCGDDWIKYLARSREQEKGAAVIYVLQGNRMNDHLRVP